MNLHDHANNPDQLDETAEEVTRASRLGLKLFAIYALIYVGFLLLNTFAPSVIEITPIPGVNLDIIYGFGLIVAALILAMYYGWACRKKPS